MIGRLRNKDLISTCSKSLYRRYLSLKQYVSQHFLTGAVRVSDFFSRGVQRHGAIKFTSIDNQCSAQVTESRTQDVLFVSDDAEIVGEISRCGDLIPPFAENPPKPPRCIQYRQIMGDLTFLLSWDSANQVVREARVTRLGRSLRRYIFLSQTLQSNPFPSDTFAPKASCRGSVFCPQYASDFFRPSYTKH